MDLRLTMKTTCQLNHHMNVVVEQRHYFHLNFVSVVKYFLVNFVQVVNYFDAQVVEKEAADVSKDFMRPRHSSKRKDRRTELSGASESISG